MNSWQQQEPQKRPWRRKWATSVSPIPIVCASHWHFPTRTTLGCRIWVFRRSTSSSTPRKTWCASGYFLPPKQQLKEQLASKTPLMTLESQSLARDFDVIAFSISFEWDYTNILTMLRLAGVPVRAASRTARDPLVVIGGAVTFVNPEPLAPFADVDCCG